MIVISISQRMSWAKWNLPVLSSVSIVRCWLTISSVSTHIADNLGPIAALSMCIIVTFITYLSRHKKGDETSAKTEIRSYFMACSTD